MDAASDRLKMLQLLSPFYWILIIALLTSGWWCSSDTLAPTTTNPNLANRSTACRSGLQGKINLEESHVRSFSS
jgi:hypothetical protein